MSVLKGLKLSIAVNDGGSILIGFVGSANAQFVVRRLEGIRPRVTSVSAGIGSKLRLLMVGS